MTYQYYRRPHARDSVMRDWLRVLLYASAFAPILISVAVAKAFDEGISSDVITLAIVGIAGTILGPLVLAWVARELESFSLKFKKVESVDNLIFAFLVSYLAPFALKASALPLGVIFAACLAVLVALWMSSTLPVHPLLRLRFYHFYKAEADTGVVYGVISKRKLHSASEVGDVKLLSHNMLLENPK